MLSTLSICKYRGLKLPLWVESLTSSFPHLISICLENFNCLDILPSLSQLHRLNYLKLEGISNVEFVENDGVVIPLDKQLIFFPSLEELELNNLPKLKGWWREETSKLITAESSCASSLLVPSIPCLRKLVLRDCPNLTVFPSCPKLISVELKDYHEGLTLLDSRTVLPYNATTRPALYLENLTIDNVGGIDCLFGDLLGSIHELSIKHYKEETLSNSTAVVRIAASIEELSVLYCNNLKSVSGVVKHLTNLHTLDIHGCENLELEDLELATVAPPISQLMLNYLPKLLNLPNELKYLTSLQDLWIGWCENFEALPEWLSCLTSLQSLTITCCRKLRSLPEAIAHMPSLKTLDLGGCNEDLKKRCRKPDGEDWPKICRIPHHVLFT